MTTFSAQPVYSITSSNTVDTITLNTGSGYTIGGATGSTWVSTVSNVSTPTFTISSNGNVGIGAMGSDVVFKWKNDEFVDCFPDFDRIQKMCEQYPGLKIAFEKFATTYRLVKDDYDTPKDKK